MGAVKKLITAPVLLILQQIWKLDVDKVEEFFLLARDLPNRERKDLMMKAVNYIRQNDPNFNWKRLTEIEGKVITNEEDRIMFSLQDTLDEVMEKGIKKGIEKGIEKGRKEGRLEERKKLALSMLKDDFNVEVICKHTGLSKEEIRQLSE